MTENDIASVVVDAALKMHKTLGRGTAGIGLPDDSSFELQRRVGCSRATCFSNVLRGSRSQYWLSAGSFRRQQSNHRNQICRTANTGSSKASGNLPEIDERRLGLLINFNWS